MGISVLETGKMPVNKVFKIDTNNTSYIFGIVDEGYLGHLYYGDKIEDIDVAYLGRFEEYPFYPSKCNRERCSFLDLIKAEYPGHGIGDYREDAIRVKASDGTTVVDLLFDSYEIIDGKPELKDLPASFANEDSTKTLKVVMKDKRTGLKVELLYSVFEKTDIITRSVNVINEGKTPLYIEKVMSACFDIEDEGFEALTLHGSWARERHIDITEINHAKISVESVRGETSHQDHPFIAIKTKGADYDHGKVYAMNFVYSGNFKTVVAKDQFDQVRMVMGIHPDDFNWKLNANDSFQAPEVVMTYSGSGLNKMSNNFHDFYRNNLIRSKYKDKKRPILINNWEATYFEFNTEKLIAIAKDASKLGIEMLVMDDGWFGNRSSDDMALGDWQVNEEKLSGGLDNLVKEVNKLGMKFGIWFEPEMISPDSNLYREHPDWAIAVKGRVATESRHQYVLDITRKEVRDYAYECVAKILRSTNIEYVKWDMNRQLTDICSVELDADRIGEFFHRYVLAVYDMQNRLVTEFPDLLLENCSGGGARFDPGMLYYSPQIWCSDDTDAIERLLIQEGTSIVYPLSTMGAHVSDCPNHTVGRVTPFETRGNVALAGTFGYELDVTKIPESDREMIPKQVEMYHKYNDLVREGDYVRVASYSENKIYDCYGVVKKDKTKALFTYVQVMARANYHSRILKLKGLDENKKYKITIKGDKFENADQLVQFRDKVLLGSTIMNAGILIPSVQGDYVSCLIDVEEV